MSGALEKVKIFEYAQALQVLRLSLRNIQSPYVASFLAIIFMEEDEKEAIEKLISWLYEYISPYVYSDPRNQTDLREKTLAIAAYIFLEDRYKSEYQLPEEYIIKFIEYASKQDWYDDISLAFISSLSSNKFVQCETAIRFLKEKLPFFISQENIEAISQSLFVQTNIGESEKIAGINAIKNYISSSSVQSNDYAWMLLVISKYGKDEDYKVLVNIKENLYRIISRIMDSYINQALSVIPDLHNQVNIKKNKAKQNDQPTMDLLTEQVENIDEGNQDIPVFTTIDWVELGLVTACLCLSKCHLSTSIVGYPEDKIIKMLDELSRNEKGVVSISKQANLLGNVLAILTTLAIGIVGSIYLFGIQIENSIIKISSTPDLGDLLLIFTWGDYFLSQIQALSHGESALEGMLKIPFIRHIGLLQRRKDD